MRVTEEYALQPLAAQVGRLLGEKGWRVTTAESCTGGGVAYLLTSIAGSSAWFEQAFVVYSNAVKQRQLRVREACLREHGAVSEACVREMVRGACQVSGAARCRASRPAGR